MSAHEITAAILLAYDQEGSCAMGVKKAEEIVSAALADAFRAGRLAQAEEDAGIASGIKRKASDPAKEIWWDVAMEIATTIRANAERLRAENEPPGQSEIIAARVNGAAAERETP